jgi:hypothetical protein
MSTQNDELFRQSAFPHKIPKYIENAIKRLQIRIKIIGEGS